MFLHQQDIRSVHESESSVIPLFYQLKSASQHIIVNHQQRDPPLWLKKVVYEVMQIVLV
jgi:hypothetical protein